MKNSSKITLCAMLSALSVVFMLLGYFPYFTYAAPAVAGLMMMVLVIEIDFKWAIAAYTASCVIIFLIGENESKLLYILFFGFYPILKAVTEKLNKPIIEWIIKVAVFNASMIIIYGLVALIFDISVDDFNTLGKYGVYIFLFLGNIVFVVYDIAISRLSIFYYARLHDKIEKILKFNR